MTHLQHVVVVHLLVRLDRVGAGADRGDDAVLGRLHFLREGEDLGDALHRDHHGAVVVGHDEVAGTHAHPAQLHLDAVARARRAPAHRLLRDAEPAPPFTIARSVPSTVDSSALPAATSFSVAAGPAIFTVG